MENDIKHGHQKIKIGISGASSTGHCGANIFEKSRELGREIVSAGGVVVTGATTGFPLWAAMGAKEAKGTSLGFSPAASEREHVEVYRLPLDYLDLIVYTGFGYSGRDLLFTRSCDAIIIGCGRISSIHEFTIAFEDGKPIGILEGEWETDEQIRNIISNGHKVKENIVFDPDPKVLVQKVMDLVQKEKVTELSLRDNLIK